MIIKPLKNRILIKRLPLPDQTEGGLFILGREYPTIGKVLAIGRGKVYKKSPHDQYTFDLPEVSQGLFSIGDLVQFSREAIRRDQELPFEKDLIILDTDQCLVGIKK